MTRPALLGLAALVLLGACSDTVDPTLGTAQAFSLYGYLDPTADRQAIRVIPIVATLEADTARALAATVTTTELGTGVTVAWRDSLVTFPDGSTGHVYVADYTPPPGETVEVSVRETGDDGRTTTVRVTVPTLNRPTVGEGSGTSSGVTFPIRVQAPRVLDARLVFRVIGLPSAPTDTVAVVFEDVGAFEDAGAGSWGLDLEFLSVGRAFLRSEAAQGASLRLVDASIQTFVSTAEWAVPAGGFDLDRIVEPGTFSNVTGGFGFVGAGFWSETRWVPSLTTQSRAGFLVDANPAGLLFLNEVNGEGWVELYNPSREAVPIGSYTVATPEGTALIPAGAVVPALGFYVVSIPPPTTGGLIQLLSIGGSPVLTIDVPALINEPGVSPSYGSFPDGRTQLTGPVGSPDLFRGTLVPTRGAPNRPPGFVALINEIQSAGDDGWVEVVTQGISPSSVLVTHDSELPLSDWVRARPEGDRWVAEETSGRLDLGQVGGEVVVVILRPMTDPRATDVRAYGPQTPGRSSGTLPDGDREAWTTGLLPTRGAPNAAARTASR